MSDIKRIDPGPRMSEATVHGGRIYCAGMIPEDTSLDITGQVKQALAEIDSLLAKGGSDKTKILTATIWLADISDFAAMNRGHLEEWACHGLCPGNPTSRGFGAACLAPSAAFWPSDAQVGAQRTDSSHHAAAARSRITRRRML